MKIKILTLLGLLFFQNSIVFSGEKFTICSSGGFYSGADNKFLSGLALYIANKNDIIKDPECTSNWKAGERVARNFSETGKLTNDFERTIVESATEFSDQVYAKISSGINLDE